MLEQMLETIKERFPLTETDCGDYKVLSDKGRRYAFRSFSSEKLGHVCAVSVTGAAGLVKNSVLIINPLSVDAPLLYCELEDEFGRNMLQVEFYDTMLKKGAAFDNGMHTMERINQKFTEAKTVTPEEAWYDKIRLYPSVLKRAGRKGRTVRDKYALTYLESFLTLCANAPECKPSSKKRKCTLYSNGLLRNGGPGVETFLRLLEINRTEYLYKHVVLGIL